MVGTGPTTKSHNKAARIVFGGFFVPCWYYRGLTGFKRVVGGFVVGFLVQVGLQSRFFTGESFSDCVMQALNTDLPAHAIRAGQFFASVTLDADSKAQALLDSI